MTVSTTGNRAEYLGNGVTTAFGFSFAFLATGDIKVYLDGSLQSTGYTVSAAPAASGTVTFSGAPANGVEVVIQRDTTKTQQIDYVANDPFAADVTESGFDRAMLAVQDVAAGVARSLRAEDWAPPVNPLSDPLNPAAILQTPATEDQARAGTDNAAYMTALRGRQQIATANIYPASLYGITPGMSGFAAALNALMATVAAAGGGVIELQEGTYTAEATLDNQYDGVLVSGPYMPILNDAGVVKYSSRIVANFAGTLTKRRSPYGASLRKTRGGGFVNVTLDGNGLATKCLEIDSVAFADIAVFVRGCVGAVAVETICGVTGTDLAEACDVQYCNIYIIGRLIDTTAEKACDVVKFGGSSNANFSLNKNVTVYCQHWDGDAVHLYNSDNNELWVYAYRAGGSGYAVRAGGARAGGVLGSENNLIRFLTGAGGAYAEGTADSGVTSGVFNFIETLDKSNGTPDPTAGTGSAWRWDTARGVSRGAAFGPMVIADSDANAISERLAFPAGRTLQIRNGSSGHMALSDGTNTWGIDVSGSGFQIRRLGGGVRFLIPGSYSNLTGLTNYADDTAAAAGGVPVNGLYRNGSVVQVRVT